jgi:multidrug transporter EmrE-like cation transporter
MMLPAQVSDFVRLHVLAWTKLSWYLPHNKKHLFFSFCHPFHRVLTRNLLCKLLLKYNLQFYLQHIENIFFLLIVKIILFSPTILWKSLKEIQLTIYAVFTDIHRYFIFTFDIIYLKDPISCPSFL